ncbi:hypothetical protein D5F01_LYC12596 [Larimichthys crocea]|uniref:Membrane-spanning 4-domains subfamily A member 4A n=1 Tax=Larimichthys crocea TaxID=215358 RepID=A0A6G0IBB4_LARCR|nr:hypothetical protein D5F01_LYC12596 [Larimichthys crocea]
MTLHICSFSGNIKENFGSESRYETQKKRRMKKTFVCDESMIITIPIGSVKSARVGQLMPERFQCVYKDSFKIFVLNGKPKPLGAAQAIAGLFIVILGLIFSQTGGLSSNAWSNIKNYTLPCVVYVVAGMLSYAAGRRPNMHVSKLSFSLNIVSLFWSIVAACFCAVNLAEPNFELSDLHKGIRGLIMTLLAVEKLIAIFLIYWLSKAICRKHFNTLPIVLLKQAD